MGAKYAIRPAATVVSTFGAVPTLTSGFGGSGGADLLYIPDAAGVLRIYYYDTYGQFVDPPAVNPGEGYYEVNADGTTTKVANPSSLTMPYDEGFIFGAASDTTLTVSGTVKTTSTMLAVAAGINYVGSVYPVGATLVTTFGAVPALVPGFGGSGGADLLYIPDPSGVLRIYYYDTYGQFVDPPAVNPGEGYYEVNPDGTTAKVADPSSIVMSSGYIFGASAAANVLSSVPSFYSAL